MVMAMAALSIIVCVFVLDLHHRNSNTPVPAWVRWLLFGHLSRCLGFPVRHYETETGVGCDKGDKDLTNESRQRSASGDRANGRKRLRTTGQDVPISAPRTRRQNLLPLLISQSEKESSIGHIWADLCHDLRSVTGTSSSTSERRPSSQELVQLCVELCGTRDIRVERDTLTGVGAAVWRKTSNSTSELRPC